MSHCLEERSTSRVAVSRTSSSGLLVEDLDKVALRIQEWHDDDDDDDDGAASREHASRGELETVQDELVPDVEKRKLKKRDGNG